MPKNTPEVWLILSEKETTMKTQWLNEHFKYDGSQLHSLFAYSHYGLLGDSLVGWRGACSVDFENMVDIEDVRKKAKIESQDMIHLIIEIFNKPLFVAIAYQRIIVGLIQDVIFQSFFDQLEHNKTLSTDDCVRFYDQLKRKGDDLYFKDKKINVSIATSSPISSLIHVGVNVSHQGTPVPTMGLNDFNIDPYLFFQKISQAFIAEYESMQKASCKVKWVS